MRNTVKIQQALVLLLLSAGCVALIYSVSHFLSYPVAIPSHASLQQHQKVRFYLPWYQQPVVYTPQNLGINLPWLNTHDGNEKVNWLNTAYNSTMIENDLIDIQAMGITKIRSWCQMESVFNYIGGIFVLNKIYAANLDDFLNRATNHGISVICVMGDGNESTAPGDLDGKFRWDIIQAVGGDTVYANAYVAYVKHFQSHTNILMWEIANEPYGNLTFSTRPGALGITKDQIHAYLVAAYNAVKKIAGKVPVGFSEYEEEEQASYRVFSDAANRAAYVDDCTDIYSMHIYRQYASQLADFRNLTGKPKWVSEFGGYNYNDPTALYHPIPARNELQNTDENYDAFMQLAPKFLNSGFSLIMPWSWADNNGMVTHNSDGSHTLYRLSIFMMDQLKGRK